MNKLRSKSRFDFSFSYLSFLLRARVIFYFSRILDELCRYPALSSVLVQHSEPLKLVNLVSENNSK